MKHLTASDFIEHQVRRVLNSAPNLRGRNSKTSKLVIALVDLLDFEKESAMILRNGLFDQFLDIVEMCQKEQKVAKEQGGQKVAKGAEGSKGSRG